MSPDPGPDQDADALASASAELVAAVDAVLGGWVVRQVERRAAEAGIALDGSARAEAQTAGEAALADVVPRLRALLAVDVDAQRSNPLAVLRGAVRYPTAVLVSLGVPAPERDEFSVRAFPEDRYDLSPAAFADVDPALHEPGLRWGAAKAYVHLRRRRTGRDPSGGSSAGNTE